MTVNIIITVQVRFSVNKAWQNVRAEYWTGLTWRWSSWTQRHIRPNGEVTWTCGR